MVTVWPEAVTYPAMMAVGSGVNADPSSDDEISVGLAMVLFVVVGIVLFTLGCPDIFGC